MMGMMMNIGNNYLVQTVDVHRPWSGQCHHVDSLRQILQSDLDTSCGDNGHTEQHNWKAHNETRVWLRLFWISGE